jgi:hypothetical protein
MFLWMICRDILKRGIPKERHWAVDRYFNMVFYGWTVIEGGVFLVPGQSTGQTLTAFSNSMCLIIMMCLHAVENQIDHSLFKDEVLFYVFGDDMVYGTTLPEFSVERLNQTFTKYGMYLETDSLSGKRFEDLTFLSSRPVWIKHSGFRQLLYHFNTEKLIASFHYTRSKDPSVNLTRYVSLCLGMWGDQDVFFVWRRRVLAWYQMLVARGVYFDKSAAPLLALLTSDQRITRIYSPAQEGCAFFTPSQASLIWGYIK